MYSQHARQGLHGRVPSTGLSGIKGRCQASSSVPCTTVCAGLHGVDVYASASLLFMAVNLVCMVLFDFDHNAIVIVVIMILVSLWLCTSKPALVSVCYSMDSMVCVQPPKTPFFLLLFRTPSYVCNRLTAGLVMHAKRAKQFDWTTRSERDYREGHLLCASESEVTRTC
ncbi:hypothetical protein BD289DRAFT_167765 [Coniella lustricola]|uniref:Uncharacterized protein n=1 Tax=Coniella lustricola TaxID=2025994 RepID=A0A2T2ZU33_9PEZI|nr:hypothetical protein BD289DRAFT_167765 [Coniella lustricola]